MDGQMNIFDYPEYLPEESFDKMTIERAAELVGTQIGMKFNRDERFSKNIYSAKSKGFTVTLSFCINYEGKRILDTQVDYKNGSYGNPAWSIDDSVKSIKSYMNRCLLADQKIDKEEKKDSKLDIPKAPIWHMSLNHVWEECPNCKIVNKAQDDVKVGYGAEAHYIYVNRKRCINCGQLFDWSDEAIEKACKYSKDYPRGEKK